MTLCSVFLKNLQFQSWCWTSYFFRLQRNAFLLIYAFRLRLEHFLQQQWQQRCGLSEKFVFFELGFKCDLLLWASNTQQGKVLPIFLESCAEVGGSELHIHEDIFVLVSRLRNPDVSVVSVLSSDALKSWGAGWRNSHAHTCMLAHKKHFLILLWEQCSSVSIMHTMITVIHQLHLFKVEPFERKCFVTNCKSRLNFTGPYYHQNSKYVCKKASIDSVQTVVLRSHTLAHTDTEPLHSYFYLSTFFLYCCPLWLMTDN